MNTLTRFCIGIVTLILTFVTHSSLFADTNCNGNSEQNAVIFLQGCAGTADNAIAPGYGDSTENIKKLVISISEKVIAFGALFAVGALVLSGILYTTSYGDDEKIKKAKTTGIYAVIGLVILLVAFPMVNIVVDFVYTM